MAGSRVAVIGAGASGIGISRALKRAGIPFEIFESTSRVGGNWQPDGAASKMYRSAHLISSKQNTQFADHPMPADYPAYPSNGRFFNYLQDVASASDLQQATHFNCAVQNMVPDGDGWRLLLEDGDSKRFDVVVVCNGLLGKPRMPELAKKATCKSLHASEYKSTSMLEGKRVLVVGGGNSGCDIAVDAAQSGSMVFHSTRRGYHYMPKFVDGRPTQEWLMDESARFPDPDSYWGHVERTFKLAGFDGRDFGLPAPDHPIQACHPIMNSLVLYYIGHGDIAPKPDVVDIRGSTVTFSDGTSETVDVIVWATGYRVDMPFLSTDVFDWKTDLSSIFLTMVPESHDNLLFVGYLNSPSGIGNLVNTMARFVTSYIQARARDSEAWGIVRRIATNHSSLDLGRARFMSTARHQYEVDLWKFLRAVNYISSKLQTEDTVRREEAALHI